MRRVTNKRFASTLLTLLALAILPTIMNARPVHAGKVVTIKGLIIHDYRNRNSGRYAVILAIASGYQFRYGMLQTKFTPYVAGVPKSKYTIKGGMTEKDAKTVEMRVSLTGKQVRQSAHLVGAYAEFVDFAGATKQAMDKERQARERAKAEAAREAGRQREQRLAEAERQAPEAREKAKREAEWKAAKAKELEAQTPRLLIGDATWKSDQVLEFKLADSTYAIQKCQKFCLDPGAKVKVMVRRVDTAGSTGIQCDFVAWDQAFLKECQAKLKQPEAKKKTLRAEANEIEKRFNKKKAERDAPMARMEGLLAKYPMFKIVAR